MSRTAGSWIPLEKFKNRQPSPQESLENYMRKMPVDKAGLSTNPQKNPFRPIATGRDSSNQAENLT